MSVIVPLKPGQPSRPPSAPQSAPADKPATSSPKQVFLDHLKVFLTILVILHHAAITYGASGGWFYQEVKQTVLPDALVLTMFTATNQSFFMGLFFFIAGCFVLPSLQRKTARQFVADKLIRLGVPVLLFVFLLYPFTIWIGYYPFTWVSLFADMPHLLADISPAHTGPCWFVAVLLVFNLLALMLRKHLLVWAEKMPKLRAGDYLLAGIGIGLVSFATRLVFPDGFAVMNIQLAYMPQYLFLFFAGVLMGVNGVVQLAANQRIAPWLWPSVLLIVGLATALGILLDTAPFVGGVNPFSIYYSLSQGFLAIALSIACLVWFYRAANGTCWWRGRVARAAYGAFFIHAPVLVALTLLLQPVSAMPMLKFALLGLTGVPLSFAIGYLLASLPLLRRVF